MDYKKIAKIVILAFTGFVALYFIKFFIDIYPDILWFNHLGFSEIFWTAIYYQAISALIFGGLFTIVFSINSITAYKIAVKNSDAFPESISIFSGLQDGPQGIIQPSQEPMPELTPEERKEKSRFITKILLAIAVLLGVMIGSSLTVEWQKLLLAFNSTSFNVLDPLFNRDISFYIFILPLLKSVLSILDSSIFLSLVGAIWLYGVNRVLVAHPGGIKCADQAKKHIAAIGALMMTLFGARKLISAWDLLYSTQGVAGGASYTDVHANLPGLYITAFASIIAAGVFLNVFRTARLKKAAISIIVIFVINILLTSAWPSFMQQFKVKPNEITLEKPYIEMDIALTRQAYNLHKVEHKIFTVDDNVSQEKIMSYDSTIRNIRLWDREPMRKSLKQLQEMRLYYDFESVFIDRYKIDNKLRQVHISLRELDYSKVPADAQTWINKHIKYTHGYGLCVSPVNKVTENGLPELIVRDIPPSSTAAEFSKIERPEIYFGELTDSYIFTDTSEKEFDYPMGEKNKYVNYTGNGGVSIGSFMRKILFSYHFWDMKIMLTNYLKSDSKVIFNRNIMQRVKKIAPFLLYDNDPYVVIADPKDGKGKRLFWIIEGYTHSDKYPYSRHRYINRGYRDYTRINYIRNSVKVVVDAYNGDVQFYAVQKDEPLLSAWSKAFPKSFVPIEKMPTEIREHLRYPEFLFRLQADIYRLYHMDKPEVFYNQEDKWDISKSTQGSGGYDYTKIPANYLVYQLPGEKEAEFVLTLPYTPTNKNNMVSFLIGRCDADNYGQLLCYNFSKEKLVYGPGQIEARIDQQKEISKIMTLWGQKGSQVIRGDILIVPVGQSLLYFQAMYLRAASGELPEFACIVVARGSRIVLGKDLQDALLQLFDDQADDGSLSDITEVGDSYNRPVNMSDNSSKESGSNDNHTNLNVASNESVSNKDLTLKELAFKASQVFNQAEKSAAKGNWKEYGIKMDQLKKVIKHLGNK